LLQNAINEQNWEAASTLKQNYADGKKEDDDNSNKEKPLIIITLDRFGEIISALTSFQEELQTTVSAIKKKVQNEDQKMEKEKLFEELLEKTIVACKEGIENAKSKRDKLRQMYESFCTNFGNEMDENSDLIAQIYEFALRWDALYFPSWDKKQLEKSEQLWIANKKKNCCTVAKERSSTGVVLFRSH